MFYGVYVALDQGYITREEFRSLYDQLERWARKVSTPISYLLNCQPQPTQRTRNPMNPTNEVL